MSDKIPVPVIEVIKEMGYVKVTLNGVIIKTFVMQIGVNDMYDCISNAVAYSKGIRDALVTHQHNVSRVKTAEPGTSEHNPLQSLKFNWEMPDGDTRRWILVYDSQTREWGVATVGNARAWWRNDKAWMELPTPPKGEDTSFKPAEGYITEGHLKHLNTPDAVTHVFESPVNKHYRPCTIIPGHWASRIESGELLTWGEVVDLFEEYTRENGLIYPYIDFGKFLSSHIARKLRGEA